MRYAVEVSQGDNIITVSLEPKGWGNSYKSLHAQTPLSLYAMAQLESADSFNNPVARAIETLYKQRTVDGQKLTKAPFGLITRDKIREGGKGENDKGRLHLRVTSFDGVKGWQRTKHVWAPKSGYIVPTNDSDRTLAGLFQEGTPVPVETTPFENRREAVKRWKGAGLDTKYLSGYYREDRIDKDTDNGVRFAGRGFYPRGDGGRFGVLLGWLPSNSGNGMVASLPPYEKTEIVGRIDLAT